MQRQRCRHRPLFPPDHDRAQIIMRRVRTMQIAGIKGRASEPRVVPGHIRSEEHTSELQSLMRISYAVFCLKKILDTRIDPEHVDEPNETAVPMRAAYDLQI